MTNVIASASEVTTLWRYTNLFIIILLLLFDECRLSAVWPPTLRPSQSTWAVSPPKTGSYRPHPPSPLLLLLSL